MSDHEAEANDLSRVSTDARRLGDDAAMYKANTAWHRVKAVADGIRALKSTPAEKEKA